METSAADNYGSYLCKSIVPLEKKRKKRHTILPKVSNWEVYIMEGGETLYCECFVGLIYGSLQCPRDSQLEKLHIWIQVPEQRRQELAGQDPSSALTRSCHIPDLSNMWLSAAEGNSLTLGLGLQTYGTCRGNLKLVSDKDFNADDVSGQICRSPVHNYFPAFQI